MMTSFPPLVNGGRSSSSESVESLLASTAVSPVGVEVVGGFLAGLAVFFFFFGGSGASSSSVSSSSEMAIASCLFFLERSLSFLERLSDWSCCRGALHNCNERAVHTIVVN